MGYPEGSRDSLRPSSPIHHLPVRIWSRNWGPDPDLTCEKPPRMMQLGGIPFFISCSMIALTGRRWEKWVSGRGGELKSITPQLGVHIRDRRVPEIPGERFAGIAAEQQQRRGGRKTPAPVPVRERNPAAHHFPLPKAPYCFLQLS